MVDLSFFNDFEQLLVSTAITANKTDMESIDLGSAGIQAGRPGGVVFMVSFDAITTADSSNFFTFELHHADARASSTSLTSSTQVTTSDGLVAADPTVKATTLTTQAQKLVIIPYVGIKRFVQMQLAETGTASITINVHAIYGHLDSEHGSKLG
jgi:hypothetical protein